MPAGTTQSLLTAAVAHHQAGRLAEAAQGYKDVLAHSPNDPDALHLLGVISGQIDQVDAGIQLILRAISFRPDAGEFHLNLAALYMRQNKLHLATSSYLRATYLNAQLFHPGPALAQALAESGDLENAIAVAERCIKINPNDADLANGLGTFLARQRRFDEAANCFRRALELRPDSPAIWANLGEALRELGDAEASLAAHEKAVQFNPNSASLLDNLGTMFREHDLPHRAIDCYRKALELEPNNAAIHWHLSLVLLSIGDFKAGWSENEWRIRDPALKLDRGFTQPQWDGSDLTGKKLLLLDEAGFGDMIHFVRYIPLIRQRSRGNTTVIFETRPRLNKLFRTLEGVDQYIRPLTPVEFDCWLNVPSLPFIFSTDSTNLPANVPYLQAPADCRQRWAGRIPRDGKLNIGLVWAGSVHKNRFDLRTRSLNYFAPLAKVPNIRLVSLQVGPESKQPRPPGMEVLDLTSEIRDFADTAALIENLDLVISVDTAVAHLAGALGRPVWVLLFTPSDFRWFRDRTDSPWYPTMRLFRQLKPRDWSGPIASLTEELCQFSMRNKP